MLNCLLKNSFKALFLFGLLFSLIVHGFIGTPQGEAGQYNNPSVTSLPLPILQPAAPIELPAKRLLSETGVKLNLQQTQAVITNTSSTAKEMRAVVLWGKNAITYIPSGATATEWRYVEPGESFTVEYGPYITQNPADLKTPITLDPVGIRSQSRNVGEGGIKR
jgi:hypothetical protein